MRAVGHLLSTLVLLPYVLLASGFLGLSHAIAAGTLPGFLEMLLRVAVFLIPWGMLVFATAFVLIAALGFTRRFRWFGALCVGVLAAASLVSILALSSAAIGMSQLIFLLPCILVLITSGWLAIEEWPGRRAAALERAARSTSGGFENRADQ